MAKSTSIRPTQKALDSLNRSMKQERERRDWIKWVALNVEPLLPEGCVMPDGFYSYSKGMIEVTIPEDKTREWRGLDGTAGLIFKLRKAFGVDKFNRSVSAYGDRVTNTYYGNGNVAGKLVYVNVRLENQLPDNCVVEYVEEMVPATVRTVTKVKCK